MWGISLADAVAKVARDAEITIEPVLTAQDIQDLILDTQRAKAWTPNTAYNYRDRVLPTVRVGHYFECTQAGTSGSTEPNPWASVVGSTQEDGTGTLVWTVGYADWDDWYDLKMATYKAWLLKAALASAQYQFMDEERVSQMPQQIHDHCLAMAARWKPLNFS